jgi:hypothetical protein
MSDLPVGVAVSAAWRQSLSFGLHLRQRAVAKALVRRLKEKDTFA